MAGFLKYFFLSSPSVKNQFKHSKIHFEKYALFIFIIAAFFNLLLLVSAGKLIEIIYGSSKLEAQDLSAIYNCLVNYSYQFAGFLIGSLAVRFLHATQQVKQVCVIALMNLILNIILNYILMKNQGVAGIALSTSFVYSFSAIAIMFVAFRTRSDDTTAQRQ
ncbi:MAG: lipid II flippase MurJ [Bdellovibrionales bacterium]